MPTVRYGSYNDPFGLWSFLLHRTSRRGGRIKFNGVARVHRKRLINERDGKSRKYLVESRTTANIDNYNDNK